MRKTRRTSPDPGAVRLRLDIAYDGTDFSGWATQDGHRTVAGVLDEALSTVFRVPVRLFAAGRTDAATATLPSLKYGCRPSTAMYP